MTEPIPTNFETGDPGDEHQPKPAQTPEEPITLAITEAGVFPVKTE